MQNHFKINHCMETITCPSCKYATSSELNFCENCENQITCLNPECKNPLRAGKTICLFCGHSILPRNKETQSNTFTRYRKQEGQDFVEEIKINMTDHAVSELAPFVTGHIIPRDSGYQDKYSRIDNGNERQIASASENDNVNYSEENNQQQEHNIPSKDSEKEKNNSSISHKCFEKDGEQLVPIEKDFKGSNLKEQLRRFILLYTSEYFYNFQKPVPSLENYQKAAKRTNIYVPKIYSTYLNQIVKEYLTHLSEGYKLNNTGEKELQKTISEIENESISSGYPYWERSVTIPAKPVRFSKDDEAKIKMWVKDEVELGKLQIGDLKKGLEYALVGIWILTIHLEKEKAVRWIDVYRYLKEKFTTIKATPNAFTIALSKSTSTKYIVKTDDKLYLNSDGKNLVEKWIAGTTAKM